MVDEIVYQKINYKDYGTYEGYIKYIETRMTKDVEKTDIDTILLYIVKKSSLYNLEKDFNQFSLEYIKKIISYLCFKGYSVVYNLRNIDKYISVPYIDKYTHYVESENYYKSNAY